MTTQIPQQPPYAGAPGPIRPTLSQPVSGYPHNYPPYSPEIHSQPKPKRGVTVSLVALGIALAAGGGIGVGTALAEPTTTPAVPAACLSAIAEARSDYLTFADTLSASIAITDAIPDALEAAMYMDADGIERFTAVITDANSTVDRATTELDASTFAADATACEAAGGAST